MTFQNKYSGHRQEKLLSLTLQMYVYYPISICKTHHALQSRHLLLDKLCRQYVGDSSFTTLFIFSKWNKQTRRKNVHLLNKIITLSDFAVKPQLTYQKPIFMWIKHTLTCLHEIRYYISIISSLVVHEINRASICTKSLYAFLKDRIED